MSEVISIGESRVLQRARERSARKHRIETEKIALREKQLQENIDVIENDTKSDVTDKLIMKGKKIQEDNRHALNNTISLASEAVKTGTSTIETLDRQQEQLTKLTGSMDDIDASMNRSKRVIRGMKSIGGAITNFFSKPKPEDCKQVDTVMPKKFATSVPQMQNKKQSKKETPMASIRVLSAKQEGDKVISALQEFKDNEKKEDEAIDNIADLLDIMKDQAKVMNRQLKTSNALLTDLDSRVTDSTARLEDANRELKKIT